MCIVHSAFRPAGEASNNCVAARTGEPQAVQRQPLSDRDFGKAATPVIHQRLCIFMLQTLHREDDQLILDFSCRQKILASSFGRELVHVIKLPEFVWVSSTAMDRGSQGGAIEACLLVQVISSSSRSPRFHCGRSWSSSHQRRIYIQETRIANTSGFNWARPTCVRNRLFDGQNQINLRETNCSTDETKRFDPDENSTRRTKRTNQTIESLLPLLLGIDDRYRCV
jgi:hypothetical protein